MTEAEEKLVEEALKWASTVVHWEPRENTLLRPLYDASNAVFKERLTPEVLAAEENALREFFLAQKKFSEFRGIPRGSVWSEMYDRVSKEVRGE